MCCKSFSVGLISHSLIYFILLHFIHRTYHSCKHECKQLICIHAPFFNDISPQTFATLTKFPTTSNHNSNSPTITNATISTTTFRNHELAATTATMPQPSRHSSPLRRHNRFHQKTRIYSPLQTPQQRCLNHHTKAHYYAHRCQ